MGEREALTRFEKRKVLYFVLKMTTGITTKMENVMEFD